MDKNISSKSKIVQYILTQGLVSKAQLARDLNLSMPTVLGNVSELKEAGLIEETGEERSTGGRKARLLGLRKGYRYSVGVNITANHIGFVLLNFFGQIERQGRRRRKFSPSLEYFRELAEEITGFIEDSVDISQVLGIGLSLPGIINKTSKVLTKSHALGLENYSLAMAEQMMPLPVYFENDANAALMAEPAEPGGNVIYLSLSGTVGGAMRIQGTLFEGDNHRAGEFGHMILVPKGELCYCGKKGCADAYCRAGVLTQGGKLELTDFMKLVEAGEPAALSRWYRYLEYLAILISNLRMAYDTDIIIGGDVGGVLKPYMVDLGEKILRCNLFEQDFSYLRTCTYNREASAVGAAKYFLHTLVEEL